MKIYDNDSGVFEVEYDPNTEVFVFQVGEGVAGDVATVTLTEHEAGVVVDYLNLHTRETA